MTRERLTTLLAEYGRVALGCYSGSVTWAHELCDGLVHGAARPPANRRQSVPASEAGQAYGAGAGALVTGSRVMSSTLCDTL